MSWINLKQNRKPYFIKAGKTALQDGLSSTLLVNLTCLVFPISNFPANIYCQRAREPHTLLCHTIISHRRKQERASQRDESPHF